MILTHRVTDVSKLSWPVKAIECSHMQCCYQFVSIGLTYSVTIHRQFITLYLILKVRDWQLRICHRCLGLLTFLSGGLNPFAFCLVFSYMIISKNTCTEQQQDRLICCWWTGKIFYLYFIYYSLYL